MKDFFDLITIGGGASGIIASIAAAERNRKVLMLEKSDHPGRKILASGNGRCNLINTGYPRYYGDHHFAEQVIARYSADRLSEYFQKIGLLTTEEEDGRKYPLTYQSSSVMSVLKNALKLNHVTVENNSCVTEVCRNSEGFTVSTEGGKKYRGKKVLIACGGAAQPKLGGTKDGYSLLKSLGHTVVPVSPALVPLNTDKKSISGLSGIRTKCCVSLFRNHEMLHREYGEVLFTEYGVSGICIMQCARFSGSPDTYIELDFLHDILGDKTAILSELKRRRSMLYGFSPVSLLDGVLNAKVSYAVMKQAGIPLHGETAGELSDDDLDRIMQAVTHYRLNINGTRGFDYAQVTAGGADCSEFNPETMESKIVPGIYAAGEVLNVDGDCGGFNLMFAFSSGITAGTAI